MSLQQPGDAAARSGTWTRRLVCVGGGLLILALCLAIRSSWGPEPAHAEGPLGFLRGKPAPAKPAPGQQPPEPLPPGQQKLAVMADVNDEKITRQDLAREALRHYGADVLDSLVNKHLIAQHCQAHNLVVTQEEVSAEIDRMAERFGLPTDQWLKMLKEQRNINPAQYAKDIIWPTVALRKIAASRCEPTEAEVFAAYETQFGPAVQTRLITVSDPNKAKMVRAAAVQKPEEFGNLAKQYSEDPNSASAKGLIQPIRKHLGDPKLGQVAFAMQPGEISEIIAVDNQYILLKCEQHIPARNVPLDQVKKTLTEACRDKKLRLAANEVFEQMQKQSQVLVVFGKPELERQHPGVAAIINNFKITVLDLAEECIERHGEDVLEGTINRRLIEQACKRRGVQVAEAEMDAEIARAAVSMGKTRPDGSPDVDGFVQQVLEEQKTTYEVYRHDMVWPTVALKKLVGSTVEVTPDDMQRGFESNYGPRVRCRAIVFNNMRKAQEVWEMARQRPTAQYFGDLAEEYSIEANSRALRGEVPPIQRFGAQPQLEEEAFKLKPGELSGVIQVGDKCVILFCEGFTRPIDVKFDEVKQLIYEDVHEKKLRATMAREFARLQEEARIDNFLAGTSQSPRSRDGQSLVEPAAARPAAGVPGPRR